MPGAARSADRPDALLAGRGKLVLGAVRHLARASVDRTMRAMADLPRAIDEDRQIRAVIAKLTGALDLVGR